MPVDGIAAGRTLLGYRTCKPGLCLYYVWIAYKAHGATADGSYPTALSAWEASPGKHFDRNPPAGVPVYFGAKPSSSAGDVVISLGGGRVAATDWPQYGVIGECTIDQRQAQIGRPYLGWTDNILGYPIKQVAPAVVEATPLPASPPEETEMKLIQATGRGIAVIGPAYFKSLTGEELGYAVELYGWPKNYGTNARAFDLARSIAVNGKTADADELAELEAGAAATIAALAKLNGGPAPVPSTEVVDPPRA